MQTINEFSQIATGSNQQFHPTYLIKHVSIEGHEGSCKPQKGCQFHLM